jgi:hypothetical protein
MEPLLPDNDGVVFMNTKSDLIGYEELFAAAKE